MIPLVWLPSLPPGILGIMAGIILLLGLFSLWSGTRGLTARSLAALLVLLWLAGPQLSHPTWQLQSQDALVIVDHSPSMSIRNRQPLVEQEAARLEKEAARLPGLTLHRLDIDGGHGHGTRLFSTLEQEASSYPHLAGAFLLTDGMNHDTPAYLPHALHDTNGHALPLHLLLGAEREETDRHLHVLAAPPYVIVGQSAHVRVQVDDLGAPAGQKVRIMERQRDGRATLVADTTTGTPIDLSIPVTHPGLTLKELYASPLPGEASLRNNRIVLRLQGVRDRLKVLLVSGVPNQSARVWRQLLKADPSVDLVHFTILRSPEADDDAPLSDMALIPFPTHELFEQKIRGFDLIILDGFRNENILPPSYLHNIASYVRNGGGLLVISGPEAAQYGSLQDTPLRDVLPAHIPDNGIVTRRFIPQLTSAGQSHPVTFPLAEALRAHPDKPWGAWYRFLAPDHVNGQKLLATDDGHPLLILNRIEQGRVAMLLSDQIWLWSRGNRNAGPQAELLRRLAHWLMKEPDLEEDRLEAQINNHRLVVERHSTASLQPPHALVLSPSGRKIPLELQESGTPGLYRGQLSLTNSNDDQNGIWTITQDNLTTFVSPPAPNPLEERDLRSTASILRPVVAESGGGIFWLGRSHAPELRQVSGKDGLHGASWIGLPRQYSAVPGADRLTPLVPDWAILATGLFLLGFGWRREGR